MAQRCALSAVRCLMGLVIPDEFDPFAEKGSQTKAPGDGEAQFRAAGGRLAEALIPPTRPCRIDRGAAESCLPQLFDKSITLRVQRSPSMCAVLTLENLGRAGKPAKAPSEQAIVRYRAGNPSPAKLLGKIQPGSDTHRFGAIQHRLCTARQRHRRGQAYPIGTD